ncbi:hypothetical protein E2562_005864 [Oryza meyeriana var. granulata]|uniref:DUF834 domain-containing protein n=1 Tax=Oryza meyeriana var. granulata TaxID=110450 RepID=A0A6G1DVV7_9ORYZ|nr:hypothetical protein E2562_005864 [Oryza meyeriana var. granulata]
MERVVAAGASAINGTSGDVGELERWRKWSSVAAQLGSKWAAGLQEGRWRRRPRVGAVKRREMAVEAQLEGGSFGVERRRKAEASGRVVGEWPRQARPLYRRGSGAGE